MNCAQRPASISPALSAAPTVIHPGRRRSLAANTRPRLSFLQAIRVMVAALGCLRPAGVTASDPPAAVPPVVAPTSPSSAPDTTAAGTGPQVILVLGAEGEPEFGTQFLLQLERWQKVCQEAHASTLTIGTNTSGDTPDRDQLRDALAAAASETVTELWLVLIGHGTFDGKVSRFNLRGPDLTADDLAAWLRPVQRPTAVINTASSSAPFLPALAATNRIVITATRSGNEQNFTRLGVHLAETIQDPAADLDGDHQTSLLEAFLSASFRVAEFYKTEGRLATEHPLIDDTGDGLGTPADWFRGLTPTKRPRDNAALDGLRAHQFHLLRSPAEMALSPETRARRDELERDIARLRESKTTLSEDEYYQRLESLLLALARLYGTADAQGETP